MLGVREIENYARNPLSESKIGVNAGIHWHYCEECAEGTLVSLGW
jgi:hypothetical protein